MSSSQGYSKGTGGQSVVVLEVRADSRFYRVLLNQLGMSAATGSQGLPVLLA